MDEEEATKKRRRRNAGLKAGETIGTGGAKAGGTHGRGGQHHFEIAAGRGEPPGWHLPFAGLSLRAPDQGPEGSQAGVLVIFEQKVTISNLDKMERISLALI